MQWTLSFRLHIHIPYSFLSNDTELRLKETENRTTSLYAVDNAALSLTPHLDDT